MKSLENKFRKKNKKNSCAFPAYQVTVWTSTRETELSMGKGNRVRASLTIKLHFAHDPARVARVQVSQKGGTSEVGKAFTECC